MGDFYGSFVDPRAELNSNNIVSDWICLSINIFFSRCGPAGC